MSHLEESFNHPDCYQQVDAGVNKGRCQQSEYRCDGHAYAIHPVSSKPTSQPPSQDLCHNVTVEERTQD